MEKLDKKMQIAQQEIVLFPALGLERIARSTLNP